MNPTEEQNNHSYPNADRKIGEDTMPTNNNPRPVEHFTNVMPKAPIGMETAPVKSVESSETDPVDKKINSVHTFKDDLVSETSKGDYSIGKIVMASSKREHESLDRQNVNLDQKKDGNLLWKILIPIIAVLIIILFSYIGSKSAKTPQQVNTEKNPTQQVASGILYSEESVLINISNKGRTDLYKEILQGIATTKVPTGKIKYVSFVYQQGTTTRAVSASDFLNLLAPSAPDMLVRNLKPEYVFGYYSYDSNEPFIILRSTNYDSTFAGMLDWERSMYADLGDLIFKKESLVTKTATASSTSTSSPSKQNVTTEYDTSFVDKVILNNDTRVLYRPNGNIAFFYTFFNKNTIIIATSEQSLREIIYRLTSGKITR